VSIVNAPDPEERARVVKQDLDSVLHPIVQHRALEEKQFVVTRAQGSTVVDHNGTEYLDAMAGLWCVNIGYGRNRARSGRRRADGTDRLLSAYRDEYPGRGAR